MGANSKIFTTKAPTIAMTTVQSNLSLLRYAESSVGLGLWLVFYGRFQSE